jgi:hypothetical protein
MSTIKSSAENLTLNADGAGNDIKFQSNASEVAEITDGGVISSTGGSTHADNIHAKFGTGNDLDIYHDGTHSYFKNSHTSGSTRFNQKYFEVNNTAGTESMISANEDSSVTLRFDGTTKLKTLAGGIQAADGILFGTDTAAANALDDYEEGTWTAAITCGTSGSITLNGDQNLLVYTKVGNLVSIGGRIKGDSISSPSGEITITGMPFSAAHNSGEGSEKQYIGVHFRDAAAEVGAVSGQTGGTTMQIYEAGTTGNTNVDNKIDGGTYIMIGGVYRTAS